MVVAELQDSSAASQYSPACGFGWRLGGRRRSQIERAVWRLRLRRRHTQREFRVMTDDELAKARREPIELRRYLWRAASVCRRNGLNRSAVVIAGNIGVLANALEQRRLVELGLKVKGK
jgi:hypothetical protein